MQTTLLKLTIVLLICSNARSQTFVPLKPSETYANTLNVVAADPTQLVMFWKRVNVDEVQFEVHCKTTGWVGVGISNSGAMAGKHFFFNLNSFK